MDGTQHQYPSRVTELIDKAIAAGYIKASLNTPSEEVIISEIDRTTGRTLNQVAIPYGAMMATGMAVWEEGQ